MEEEAIPDSVLSPEAVNAMALRAQQMLADAAAVLATAKDLTERLQSDRLELEAQRRGIESYGVELKEVGQSVATIRRKVEEEQTEIATKSGHIQSALNHAVSVVAEVDALLESSKQHDAQAMKLLSDTQNSATAASEAHTETVTYKQEAQSHLTAAQQCAEGARSAMATAKNLAARADTIEVRIDGYEKKLVELQTEAEAGLQAILGLLPAATAAGLASAFDSRRQSFLQPASRWQRWFVGSLVALVVLALTGLWHAYMAEAGLTWDALARLWIARLPIAAALIWLALHASREAALAKRLEEDYGYKAAIAASFQGFQKQMAAIGADAQNGSPLAKLCGDTLTTLANPPGRIYDKHRLVVSPATDVAKALTDAVGRGPKGD